MHARIVHTGLNVENYSNSERHHRDADDRGRNLLYAGRLVADKGIDTAIRAMAKLVFNRGQRDMRLSLAGSGSTDYENYLHSLVSQAGLTDYVSFLGWVSPEEMPELLRKFEVLLVPSIWPEPLARIVLEGMATGLVVLATPTGGTREILTDGENGLLFAPDDPEDLAQKIVRLADDSTLRRKLARAGRQTVAERFTVMKMLDEMESYLQEIATASLIKETS
jgi:glycosyltransferase involved in cell wall biosynthesis